MIKKLALILMLSISVVFAQQNTINHNITAKVDPLNHYIEATDTITIPEDQVDKAIYFLLVSDLTVTSETPGVIIRLDKSRIKGKEFGMDVEDFSLSSSITQNKYKVVFKNKPEGDAVFTIRIKGEIYYKIKQSGQEYARGFSQTPGIICEKGVYLGGSTYWVPWFNNKLISFKLTTILPGKWNSVSQGKRIRNEIVNGKRITCWDSPEPMEEIYLIAAKFTEYKKSTGAVDVMAFLRTPDQGLANKYLETTAQYLEMYRKLVGPYPFSKFALVENFWETGYGMPSFTLLGEQIIRFPFILHSSYPHELLHNYWGNSVYVDFSTGNWCEGITVYMADHLIKEQRGLGSEYRRATIQKYTDYVNPENDFPLNQFLARHDAASEAVGYGKSMMMFNMLRDYVGDEIFIKGFQKFYRDNKYRIASFDNIRMAMEKVSGKDLKSFFDQWVNRTGAPELGLEDVKAEKVKNGYSIEFTLNQRQDGNVFVLNVPVAVWFSDKTEIKKIKMTSKTQSYKLFFKERPLIIKIDPQFQLFRKLHYYEIPPALSKIFGTKNILIILPSKAAKGELENYKLLAQKWSKDKTKNIIIKLDSEITKLPSDRAVWIFGDNNSYKNIIVDGIKDFNADINEKTISFNKSNFNTEKNSFVIAVRHPENNKSVAAWLTIAEPKAVDGLARKLLHYGKYSYLVFEGSEPVNIAKGQWKAVHSPLERVIKWDKEILPGKDLELPRRKALAYLAPVFSADRMMKYIKFLASDDLKGRGLGTSEIDSAADFIAEQFKNAGLLPGADNGTYFQEWKDVINKQGDKGPVRNVIGIIPGTNKSMAGESVIVCAHYDHLGLGWPDVRKGNEGKIHNGADDNASGVAVMLELANLLGKSLKPQRTIVFIAFTAEENGLVGSRYYVKNATKYPAKKIIGALNLDTVGRLFDKKLLVLNTSSAREWKFIFMGAGYVTGVDAEMVNQNLDASDQMAFIEAGIPAVQFFSGAHADYHRPTDTFEKIDAAGMVKVASFVREAILYLADRKEPLTFVNIKKPVLKKNANRGVRRSSTGSVPDFSFSGSGVKLAAVNKQSPADKAGLKKGDIIIKFGKNKITDLKDYSDALKGYKPGDKVKVIYLRNGKEYVAEIVLSER